MSNEFLGVAGRDAPMTHRERFFAAMRGEPVDRTPISFWHHFPNHDMAADSLAEATVEFQRRFDLDFLKLMPTGMYSVLDYGLAARVVTEDGIGSTRYVSGPISTPEDWRRLPEVSPGRGALREQVELVRRLRAELGPDVPFVQTIFSPLTMAAKLVGGKLDAHIGEKEQPLREGLEKMADDVIAFGLACLEAGVDGFFFASQWATRSGLPAGVHDRLGVPYDLKVLEALRPGSAFLLLHLHGAEPLFDLAESYPVDGVNWHDRETAPSLAEAMRLTGKGMVAGISRMGAVARGRPEAAAAEVRDAVAQTGGRRLCVGPGCVVPFTTPTENLLAARRAVEEV